MTNKEHLATLSSDEWVQRVEWLYHIYGKAFTHTLLAVKDWLDKEYEPVKPYQGVCPVCYLMLVEGDKKCRRCMTDIEWNK